MQAPPHGCGESTSAVARAVKVAREAGTTAGRQRARRFGTPVPAARLKLHEPRGDVLLLRGARLADPLSLHEHLHGTGHQSVTASPTPAIILVLQSRHWVRQTTTENDDPLVYQLWRQPHRWAAKQAKGSASLGLLNGLKRFFAPTASVMQTMQRTALVPGSPTVPKHECITSQRVHVRCPAV